MPEIHNNTEETITLPTGHAIEPMGRLPVTDEVLKNVDNAPFLNPLVLNDRITVWTDAELEKQRGKKAAKKKPEPEPAPAENDAETDESAE